MLSRYQRIVGALTLLFAGTATLAHADDAATRSALQKQYAKITQAYKTKSIKPIQEVTTPDYTIKMPSGQIVTRQQMESQFAMQLSFLQNISATNSKLGKIVVNGKEAKVDAQETLNATLADPQTPGKVLTVNLTTQYRDTWVKSASGWLRKHSDLLKITTNKDGKPVDVTGGLGSRPVGQTKK